VLPSLNLDITDAGVVWPSSDTVIDDLVVFGDSYSDFGNIFSATGGLFPPSPPYFEGRFSNGPIWVDFLSEGLGLEAEDVLNFATGGATTGRDGFVPPNLGFPLEPGLNPQLPGLLDQLDDYVATAGTDGLDGDDLHVLWFNGNELQVIDPTDTEAVQTTITQAVTNIATAVTTLVGLGAEQIAIANAIDIGTLPLALQAGAGVLGSLAAGFFNDALAQTIEGLEQQLGLDLLELDAFGPSQAFVANPDAFGFTNVTEPLLDVPDAADPAEFLFWDDLHYTTQAQQFLAQEFLTDLALASTLATVEASSDHRLVYADVDLARPGANRNRVAVTGVEALGEISFATGETLAGTEIGGLSGLAYDPVQGVYYALADDRSAEARFYTLGIDLSDGSLDQGDVAFQSATQLLDAEGNPYADGVLDPEGIALTGIGTLYISSEGDASQLIDPFVRQFSLTGQQLSELPVPAKYRPTADQTSGIRNNLAFESLTLSPDQRFLYTATENALYQDGPAATLEDPSLSRILKYDLSTGEPVAEFVYEVEEVPDPPIPADDFATNGLVELLALDNNGTFLALERAFSAGVGNTVKLYQVNAQGALDVFGTPDLFREAEVEVDDELLPPGPFEIDPAVIKTELVDIEADLGIEPDNLEGIAMGPVLPDGRQSLIVASDNNFNDTQKTQFIALALDLETTPAALPVVETPYTIDDNSFEEFAPLNILLVNDDGFEAAGLQVMYDALVAAGHQVTLVAPKEQQSGQGTRINVESIFQPTELEEFAPGQWFVDGTPVTTTLAALDVVLEGEAPDLVISGINEGANVGANIAISSGTVSAAATAIQRGIPAIAVSAEPARDENFEIDETALDAAYGVGAQTVLDLITKLQQTGGEGLLPEGTGLNVNIPAQVENLEGVALTRLDGTGTFGLFVDHLAPGTPGLLFQPGQPLAPEDITVADSEGQNFLADFLTITPIDGDWTGSENDRVTLQDRIAAAPEDATATPLNILLTNDDGFDAPGIEALYHDLIAAGHTVTLVGPLEQQSGTGTSLDVDKILQPLDIVNVEGDKWYVDAGVRTTTWTGLDAVLEGEAPDLVISGINEGENIGPGGAVSSGTVSAAVTALLRGVPAMAISGGISFTDDTAVEAAYHAGADFITTLIAQLQATQGDDATILPAGLGLSINVPVRFPEGVEKIQGVKFTDASDITPFVIDFGPVDEAGGVGLRFAPAEVPAEFDPTSEGGQFLSGFITVTPIDGNWTAPEFQAETIDAQLAVPDPVLAGDSDDPAIWVHPTNPEQSVVFATLKDGGLVSFDLQGNILETYRPADFGNIRYNNVDLVYGFTALGMMGEFQMDLAVLSDRANDTLTILQIDPDTGAITDVTSPHIPATIFGVDDGEATAYGLATYTSPVTGKSYAFVTQADGNLVAQLELIPEIGPADEIYVNAEVVRTLELPVPTGDPVDSQSEGLVIDQELGLLYVALENEVGILRFSAEPEGGNEFSVIQSVEADYLVPDIEGLNIYYGPDGTGYLIANSQGDSSYAVFSREGTNEYLGSFIVGGNGDIDQVNESDGLDVVNVPLGPSFPNGLLVLQDGANDPQNVAEDEEELENNSTNFKFVPWENVADSFDNPLLVDPVSYDPRNPQPQSLVNGVASGDVSQDAVVLWARSTFLGEVTFDYSTSPDFAEITGTTTATVTDITQPVKVDVQGLTPGTEYYYRVTDAAGDMETGQFQTAAALGDSTGLTFGIAGDWQQAPPYPILTSAAASDLDFFVKLGDTIYADLETPATPGVSQARTLEQFRAKHSEILSPRFGLSAVSDLYGTTPVFATIDDHELVDNFAGGAAPGESPDAPDIGSSPDPLFTDEVEFVNDTQAYEAALQAYQEYHPIQDRFYDTPEDPRTDGERQLYRSQTFGSDAALFMLDSRSFRDVQLPPADLADPTQFLVEAFDPSRTLLGRAQVELLKQDLLAAEANGVTWKFVTIPEPIQNFGVVNAEDRFEGYAAERTEILKFIDDNAIDNVVFMAGDFHGTIVNNLTYQEGPGQEQIATNAFEVVTGPVAFFDGRFGPNVANLSAAAGIIGPDELAFYNSLPVAPDSDSELNDQDDFVKQLLVAQTDLFGYDPVGLDTNLATAEGLIDATLLQGDYLAAHNYSWTEFDIAPDSQTLTVTTFGIDAYSEADVLANPDTVLGLEPTIISQFEVTPQNVPTEDNTPPMTDVLSPIDSFEAPFGAEILAYDPTRQALYVISGGSELQVLDASDPTDLSVLFTLDLAEAAGVPISGANSVAYQGDLLAVAIEAETATDPGVIALVDLANFADDPAGSVNALVVGALPDMVTFSPDGTTVLVANEGEPDEGVDPDGSVSIIDVSGGIQSATVQTADFTAFNGRGSRPAGRRSADLPRCFCRSGLRARVHRRFPRQHHRLCHPPGKQRRSHCGHRNRYGAGHCAPGAEGLQQRRTGTHYLRHYRSGADQQRR
jgi:5'/3'-nucleotidase SurE